MKRILIVDDDPMFRKMVGEFLRRAGFLVQEAKDGFEALTSLKRQAPNLIFLDVMMPEMSGYEVMQWIKFNPDLERLPILVVSAQEEFRGVALNPAADVNFMHKSCSPKAMVSYAARVLNGFEPSSDQAEYEKINKDAEKLKKYDELLEREQRMLDQYIAKKLADNADNNRFLR
jgi:two-component system chemotaxis response regulator CheY